MLVFGLDDTQQICHVRNDLVLRIWQAVLVCMCLAGCSNQPTSMEVAADGAATADGETATVLTEEIGGEEPGDAASAEETWLKVPSGIDERLAEQYVNFAREASDSEEPMAAASFSAASHLIGVELDQSGDQQASDRFAHQAADALRASLAAGIQGLPNTLVVPVFFAEAKALGRENKVELAREALQQAVQAGYTDFDAIANDASLANVRQSEGFEEQLEDWKQSAKEAIQSQIRGELAAAESFPFAFELADLEGNVIALDDFKGQVVIVDIWGTWCPPCRAEIPSFVQLQSKYGAEDFQMIGINYERGSVEEANRKLVADFIEQNGINYPCVMGDEATQRSIPNFQGFPTTIFIDKTGKVRLKAVGLHSFEYLDAIVSELLAES